LAKDVASTLRALARGCIVAACSVVVPQLAAAQGNLAPDEARKRLETSRGRLEASERRSKELQKDLDKIAAERQRINARLVETAKLIQQSEALLNVIEARLGELAAQEENQRRLLEQSHGRISTVLAAMLRMGRNPPPVMVTSPKDVLSAFRSGMLSTSVFFELNGEAVSLSEKLADLGRVMASKREESEKLRREAGRLNDARVRLAGAQEEKRQSLAERQAELVEVRQAAAEFTKNVADLGELIAKLDKEVQEKTGLGAYEKEVASAAPATPALSLDRPLAGARPPPSTTASTSGPTPAGQSEEPSASVVLAPIGDRVAMLTPGRIKPAMPFGDAKGLLPLPAQGRRVLTFGEKTQYGSQSKGLVLETRQGGQVVSPSDGWIVYAGEFRSYGQLLIINAGGGYHILLAGLSQIDVQLGQFVLAGEPVGVMSTAANTPSGKTQDNAPILYIEFRKDQRPIDPDPWWADASRKVQG
jgi:septal ring factor EnvC (AmiA/AmiB activator)